LIAVRRTLSVRFLKLGGIDCREAHYLSTGLKFYIFSQAVTKKD